MIRLYPTGSEWTDLQLSATSSETKPHLWARELPSWNTHVRCNRGYIRRELSIQGREHCSLISLHSRGCLRHRYCSRHRWLSLWQSNLWQLPSHSTALHCLRLRIQLQYFTGGFECVQSQLLSRSYSTFQFFYQSIWNGISKLEGGWKSRISRNPLCFEISTFLHTHPWNR